MKSSNINKLYQYIFNTTNVCLIKKVKSKVRTRTNIKAMTSLDRLA